MRQTADPDTRLTVTKNADCPQGKIQNKNV